MGWNNPDPYHQPEQFDLTPIAYVDWYGDEACYEFSCRQIWKHADGLFYWADDSGCSCNAPFEYFEDDMLEKGTWSQAIASLQSALGDSPRPEVAADVSDAIEAILKAR